MEPKLLDYQHIFDAVLPPEWALIGRCRSGSGVDGGCFVLAHAEIGVALVDLLPNQTRDAEAQLRRLLNAVDFSASCRGYLPVIHCAVGEDEIGQLRQVIEDCFAYDSVLTIADRGRWVGVLRRTLQAGVTWESLGWQAPKQRTGRAATMLAWPTARLRRTGLAVLGVASVFGLGFTSGLLWPAAPDPVQLQHSQEFGVVASTTGFAPVAPTADSHRRFAGLSGPVAIFDDAASSAPDGIAPAPMPTLPAGTAPTEPKVVAAGAGLSAGSAVQADTDGPDVGDAGLAQAPSEVRNVALSQPARTRARPPLPIDRRCSEAVFRYQQGALLTSQEMAHVRQGCASWR